MAGKSIESMAPKTRISSFTTPQCLSSIQVPGHNLIMSRNSTGHIRLVDYKTFKENVETNLGLTISISNTQVYKMLVWTGVELKFFDIEADKTVIGYSNPSVKLAQEIFENSAKKESQILKQLKALKLFAASPKSVQKRGLVSWIFSSELSN